MPFEIDEPRKGKVAVPKAKGGTKAATPPAPDASNNGLIPPPGVPAPPGFLWVFNRLNIPFERPFDGLLQRIEPHGYQLFSLEVANHLYRHSLILDDLQGHQVYALALENKKGWGKPLAPRQRRELIDRTSNANPYNWPADTTTKLEYQGVDQPPPTRDAR
mgnify:CR=1 FL=1